MIYGGIYSYFTTWLLPTWLLESTTSMFIFLVFFLWFYGFMLGCSLQHLYLVGPSILQWLKWLFGSMHWFVVVVLFLSYHFNFFFSLETSWLPFILEPLGYPLILPIFSIYCSCTHASLNLMGLKRFTCLHKCLFRHPKYLMSTSHFLVYISNIMAIFLT